MLAGLRYGDGAMTSCRRLMAVVIVLLAVLAPTLALASMHCLTADCDGPCVAAVTASLVVIAIASLVSLAAPERASIVRSVAIRLPELPPRRLHSAV